MSRVVLVAAVLGGIATTMARRAPERPAEAYDLVLAGGRVVDGTGAPWFVADVGIRGDRVAAIRDLSGAQAARRLDASGHLVSPGFIDMLGQSDATVEGMMQIGHHAQRSDIEGRARARFREAVPLIQAAVEAIRETL